MLATLIPDVAGNVVGKANAQAASRRIFATVNNQRLNTSLAFEVLDEIVDVLFPKAGEERSDYPRYSQVTWRMGRTRWE